MQEHGCGQGKRVARRSARGSLDRASVICRRAMVPTLRRRTTGSSVATRSGRSSTSVPLRCALAASMAEAFKFLLHTQEKGM
eukprot:6176912-Pleurochrysis_carterae.AAC.4